MKYNKAIFTLTVIATIISFMLGVSYAFFSINTVGNETASTQLITTANLKITYQGTDTIDTDNMEPGETTSTTFTVKNDGNVPVNNYQVYFSNVINQILNDEMIYTLTCVSDDANPCEGKVETPVPTEASPVLTQASIAPGTTHTYTLTVTFKETGSNQDYNQKQIVSFKITINEQHGFGTLIARQSYNSNELFWEHSANITEVTFEDSISIPNGVTFWDVSANQDESVMAYIIDDGLGADTFHLYIMSNGEMLFNPNSSNFFSDFFSLEKINNLEILNTTIVNDLSWMFNNCSNLNNLDLSAFNTSNVTNMGGLFYGCSNLKDLNIDTFDTRIVTSMYSMFANCGELETLNLMSFNVEKVIDMNLMFSHCSKLTTLNLSKFKTSSLLYAESMFEYCRKIVSLDLGLFDVSKVKFFFCMFYECNSLTYLNISSFVTNNCQSMQAMFLGCSSLDNIDIDHFNTSKVIYMGYLFYGCSGLTELDLTNFDTSKTTDMSYMFKDCINLTSIDLTTFNTANVTKMSGMFGNCSSLSSLDLSMFITTNLKYIGKDTSEWSSWSLGMFESCTNLISIDFRSASFEKVTDYLDAFANIKNGVNILVKDNASKTFIEARLSDAGKTGNVTIYVP